MQTKTAFALLISLLGLLGSTAQASDEAADRFRASLQSTSLGVEISATLESGETIQGELAETDQESFGLWIEPDEAVRKRLGIHSARMKKKIRYEEVKELSGARELAISGEDLRSRVRIGDSIRVRTSDGRESRGEVEAFDGDLLLVDERSFRLSNGEVQRIELKDDDSLRNGALIGFGFGAGWVAFVCLTGGYCEPGVAATAALILGAGGAGLGALIDAAHTGSEPVYVSPRAAMKRWDVAPLLTRDAKGLLVRLRF